MSLPFNSYDQMRYRGNEYVTDQTLNRTVYRLFQNDVYLDNALQEHITDDSVHYSDNSDGMIDRLTSDKQVLLLPRKENNVYYSPIDVKEETKPGEFLKKSWQRIIDEQPKNLGGNIISFKFKDAQDKIKNPGNLIEIFNQDVINFSGFYGGTLIIESFPAMATVQGTEQNYQTGTSAVNQNLSICSDGRSNTIINIENCHCKVLIRNCRFNMKRIVKAKNIGVQNDTDWNDKDGWTDKMDGTVYCNYYNGNGTKEMKRYSANLNKWTDLNMLSAIRITKSPDVEIKHCYIEYNK